MKLGDILSAKNQAGLVPSVTKPVEFKITAKGKASGEHLTATVRAVLSFVTEEERAEAIKDAGDAVAKRYAERAPGDSAMSNEIALHMLARALRDADDPRQMFATVDELRKALVQGVATRLYSEYLAYESEEFPDTVSDATMTKLLGDAKKKSLVDLLYSYGSSLILRVLPTLAIASGAPRQPSTSDTGSV